MRLPYPWEAARRILPRTTSLSAAAGHRWGSVACVVQSVSREKGKELRSLLHSMIVSHSSQNRVVEGSSRAHRHQTCTPAGMIIWLKALWFDSKWLHLKSFAGIRSDFTGPATGGFPTALRPSSTENSLPTGYQVLPCRPETVRELQCSFQRLCLSRWKRFTSNAATPIHSCPLCPCIDISEKFNYWIRLLCD